MKLTSRLLQCVLLVLLSCRALMKTTKLENEKSLNDALKKHCNAQLYIHSEYILKNLLIDERFAQMIFKNSSSYLSQLVDYLSLLCDTASTGFTLEHFVSKLESLEQIKDSFAYGQDYIKLERDDFLIKNVLGIQKKEGKVTRKHIVEKLVTDFEKYYKLSDKNKLKKYRTKIMHKNRLKMAMFMFMLMRNAENEPDKQDENNKTQGAINGVEEVKPPVKDPPKKSKTCCGLGWFKLLLGGGTFGVTFTSGLFAAYARSKYWPEWAWGPAPFTTSSSSVHNSSHYFSSSSSRAPAILLSYRKLIVAVLVLIAIAVSIVLYYQMHLSKESRDSPSHEKATKKKKHNKRKANKDSSSSPTPEMKVPVKKHNKDAKKKKGKSPKSIVQPIPSDAPTNLLAPSDYEHIFHGSKANNKSKKNGKQPKAAPSSLIGSSGSSVWDSPQAVAAAVSGQKSGAIKISSSTPSTVPAVADRKKAKLLKQKSIKPKANVVVSSRKETNQIARKKK